MGTTLNISQETKTRFDIALLKYAAVKGERLSVDEFMKKLLDRWDE